jgi:hypothetical protein
MKLTTTLKHLFDKCCLDIAEPLTETENGNRYIPTFQNDLSKFLISEPICQHDGETISKEFVIQVILKYRTPSKMPSKWKHWPMLGRIADGLKVNVNCVNT